MHGIEVLSIPIYRKNPKDFNDETEKLKKKYIYKLKQINSLWSEYSESQKEENIKLWTNRFYESDDGKGWKFNDIIGFITINAGAYKIKCYYWFVTYKRNRRDTIRKIFKFSGKLVDFDIFITDKNSDISSHLMTRLLELQGSSDFNKYYIDIEKLRPIIENIHWTNIVSEIY